jgi:hypothetical protein
MKAFNGAKGRAVRSVSECFIVLERKVGGV